MSMLSRIVRKAGLKKDLLQEQLLQEIESGQLRLPLAVTFSTGDRDIPARVTKLLKQFFVVDVDSYTSEGGEKVSIGAVKLTYRGEPYGRKQPPKKYQSTRPRNFHSGVYGEDLQKVRVMSGRSPN